MSSWLSAELTSAERLMNEPVNVETATDALPLESRLELVPSSL